jgi:hypothetical protein
MFILNRTAWSDLMIEHLMHYIQKFKILIYRTGLSRQSNPPESARNAIPSLKDRNSPRAREHSKRTGSKSMEQINTPQGIHIHRASQTAQRAKRKPTDKSILNLALIKIGHNEFNNALEIHSCHPHNSSCVRTIFA